MSSGNGDRETAERRLVALMCSTVVMRQSRSHEAGELLSSSQPEQMIELLRRLHLTVLVGQRLWTPASICRVREEVEVSTALSRQRGAAHELATLSILDALEAAGTGRYR